MPWLVSYQYRYGMRRETGIHYNEPMDMVDLIEEHPASYFADMRVEILALESAPYTPAEGPQTAYDVCRIYSVIEVPGELLTDKQREAFE